MNLQEFVSETLKQIDGALTESGYQLQGYNDKMPTQRGGKVDFEVSVIANKEGEKGAKLEVAYFLKAGVGGKQTDSAQSVSKIKFTAMKREA